MSLFKKWRFLELWRHFFVLLTSLVPLKLYQNLYSNYTLFVSISAFILTVFKLSTQNKVNLRHLTSFFDIKINFSNFSPQNVFQTYKFLCTATSEKLLGEFRVTNYDVILMPFIDVMTKPTASILGKLFWINHWRIHVFL